MYSIKFNSQLPLANPNLPSQVGHSHCAVVPPGIDAIRVLVCGTAGIFGFPKLSVHGLPATDLGSLHPHVHREVVAALVSKYVLIWMQLVQKSIKLNRCMPLLAAKFNGSIRTRVCQADGDAGKRARNLPALRH